MQLYFTFPQWKQKAVSFSYDDATIHDRRLVEILNQHNLRGTFNISPGKLRNDDFVRPSELPSLYKDHEIASHGYAHLHLNDLSPTDLHNELFDGRAALEDILGCPIPGFASPYGDHGPKAVAAMREIGFAYARPASTSHKTYIPNDPFFWESTTHHNDNLLPQIQSFLKNSVWGGALIFLNIFGHSYEFARNNNWNLIEEAASLLGNNDALWSATNLEVLQYVRAFRDVTISLDGTVVRNNSSIPLYARWGESHGTQNVTPVILPPSEWIDLKRISSSL